MELNTRNLLLQRFSAVECQGLFPKQPNRAIQAEIKKLHKEIDDIKKLKPGPERISRQSALNNACRILHKQHKTKGLRIDVQIIDPRNQQEVWVDTTCIHPTCQSRIRQEMKHTLAKIQSQEAVRLGEHKDPTINEIGYEVRD